MTLHITFSHHSLSCPQCGSKNAVLILGRPYSSSPDIATNLTIGSIFSWVYEGPAPSRHRWFLLGRGDCPSGCGAKFLGQCFLEGCKIIHCNLFLPNEANNDLIVYDTVQPSGWDWEVVKLGLDIELFGSQKSEIAKTMQSITGIGNKLHFLRPNNSLIVLEANMGHWVDDSLVCHLPQAMFSQIPIGSRVIKCFPVASV